MLSEILKIIPKLDNNAMKAMEQSLASRFGKIAKGFGSGIKNSLLGGGIAGAALAIINKILNPLEEVQKAIDATLHTADDLDTFAKQFHTTPGQLLNLQSLAGAKGLSPEELRMLMIKFQDKVTEARADSNAPSSVRNFADNPNTAAAFFDFIQGMQKLTAAQRDFVQADVFGAKQVLKASEFLNETNFKNLADILELKNGAVTDPKIKMAADAEEAQRILQVKRENQEFLDRAGKITAGMLNFEDMQIRKREDQTTKNLDPLGYEGLKTLQMTGDRITFLLEDGIREIAKSLPAIARALSNISGSRETRGQTGKKDK
jgi:hypothetical protein